MERKLNVSKKTPRIWLYTKLEQLFKVKLILNAVYFLKLRRYNEKI